MLLFISFNLYADTIKPDDISEALTRAHIKALHYLDVPPAGRLPEIVVLPTPVVAGMANFHCDETYCPVAAVYNHHSGTIFLAESIFDIPYYIATGLLIHEIVHYLQHEHNIYNLDDCWQRKLAEAQAYHIQNLYLKRWDADFEFWPIVRAIDCRIYANEG